MRDGSANLKDEDLADRPMMHPNHLFIYDALTCKETVFIFPLKLQKCLILVFRVLPFFGYFHSSGTSIFDFKCIASIKNFVSPY